MKPFPEAVQMAFPCMPGRVAERPWWSTTFYKSVRCDGPEVAPEEVARIDAEHPLPHPGYRAGQIWADENGNSILVLFRSETSILTVKTMPMWGPSFTGYSGSGDDFLLDYPYLIADPACPHLAPWSPVENK